MKNKKLLLFSILTILLCAVNSFAFAATINVSTVAELKAISDNVANGNTYVGDIVNLTANINLNGSSSNLWTPIGNATYPFDGTFEGNNHTISGLYVNRSTGYAGLFGKASSISYIKNVAVSGTVVGGDYTAGLVGYSNGRVENCTNNCTVSGSVTDSQYISGIAGTYNNGKILNCVNTGNITGGKYVGGICGLGYAGEEIVACENTGTITTSNTVNGSTGYFGGIAGKSYGLDDCINRGRLNTATMHYVGGIVGCCSDGHIKNCKNINASVSGVQFVGGIAGEANGTEGIQFCSNTGVITSTSGPSGGLAGRGAQVESSYNTGTVNGRSDTGGLVGSQNSYCGINKSYNQGTIVASGINCNNVGGLVGRKLNGGYIRDSYNQGDVTSASNYVGGIVGYSQGAGTKIERVYNLGTVKGENFIGGITGYVSQSNLSDQYTNIYNIGTVITGSSYIVCGGIVGEVSRDTQNLRITNAYNAGTVRDGSGRAIFSNNVDLTNVYYLAGVGVAQGTSKTEAALRAPEMVDLLNGSQNPIIWKLGTDRTQYYPDLIIEGLEEATGEVYEIWNIADLNTFSANVNNGNEYNNCVVKLMADINYNGSSSNTFTPIGGNSKVFQGIFEGNGHTISNLYVDRSTGYAGLFGQIGSGAQVRNVTVTGTVKGGNYTAGVVGYNGSGKIVNCINNCTVTGSITEIENVGGICGRNNGTISSCKNNGNITGYKYVGGITGYSGSSIAITSCENTGIITTSNTVNGSNGYFGGIAGQGKTIEDCVNKGRLNTATMHYVGGIVGYSDSGHIKSCKNEAPLSGVQFVGGIAGEANGTEGIQFCSNTGVITSTSGPSGGLAGRGAQVESSYNTGTVNGRSDTGGLVGSQNSYCGINKSYNQGTIVASGINCNNVGGLVGRKLNGGYIRDSYNQGDVTSASNYVGGIVGYSQGAGTKIERVYNLGTVKGENFIGGITGYVSQSNLSDQYTNIYNIGTVITGSSYIVCGGIVGEVSRDTQNLRITNAYNAGTVRDGSGRAIFSNNVDLTNVYYLAGVGVAQGTSKTEAALRAPEMVDLLNGSQNPIIWKLGTDRTQYYPDLIIEGLEEATGEVYEIWNIADLNTFSANVNNGNEYNNCVVKLMADINYNGSSSNTFTPIGGNSKVFQGIFEGNGHTISNLYVDRSTGYAGLFGQIGSGAQVRNVTVTGTVKGGNYTAGVVGYNGSGKIVNCINNCTVTGSITEIENVGGICGRNNGTISSCKNNGNITGYKYVGGITGYSGSSIAITSCENTGIITTSNTVNGFNGYFGGIAGQGKTIEDCVNKGRLNTATMHYVGGIVGYSDSGHIKSCKNEAPLSGVQFVGGIAGEANGTEGIQFCSNTGVITSTSGPSGGLAGRGAQVESSYNTGTVNGRSDTGGLVGSQNSYCGINKSYNQGTIVASGINCNNVGGLVGRKLNGGYIRDSYNQGDVTSASNYVGGIVGYSQGAGTKIERVYNLGTVKGENFIGGITGYVSQSNLSDQYTNIYNIGTVITGSSYIVCGGIVGEVSRDTQNLRITNAYNAGTVRDGSGRAIFSNNVDLTNVYYLAGVGTAQGTVRSEAQLRSTEMVDLLNGTQDPKVWIKSPGIDINRGFPMFEFYPGRGELIRDEVPPTVVFNPNGNSEMDTPSGYKASSSTTIVVADNVGGVGLKMSSLGYVLTQSFEQPADMYYVNSFSEQQVDGSARATVDIENKSGIWYIWVKAADNNNNVAYVRSNPFYLDIEPPTATISIESLDTSHNVVEVSGKKFSSSNVVKINIEAQDNVSSPNIMKMFLVNENQYSTLRNQDIVWVDYSNSVNWTLTPGESRRRVYIIIKDAAGNQSTYAAE